MLPHHNGDFSKLEIAHDARLVSCVSHLPRDCGKREIWRNKKARHHDGQHRWIPAAFRAHEGRQEEKGKLQQVVVERAEKLDRENRSEAAAEKHGHLGHGLS